MKMVEQPCLSRNARFAISCAVGSTLAQPIINQINLWLRSSGPEWTVGRLKNIRTIALQLKAGNRDIVREIYADSSIAHGRDLIPSGPFRPVVRLFVQARQPHVMRRLEVVLRVYTSVTLSQLSHAQFMKAKQAITGPSQTSRWYLDYYGTLVADWCRMALIPAIKRERGIFSFKTSDPRPNLGKGDLSMLRGSTGTHRADPWAWKIPRSFLAQPYGKAVASILTATWYPNSLLDLVDEPGTDRRSIFKEVLESSGKRKRADRAHVGHISFIQERGAKARVVAVPTALVQWTFQPLHRWLDRVCQTLVASCMHDQNKGAFFLQKALREDRKVFCFDLSSATDRFPIELQLKLLEALGLGQYAAALRDVASGDWLVTAEPEKGSVWKYEVGQPMGLYGSFPLFHLTHIALLSALWMLQSEQEARGTLVDPPFRVLGDDVIITDPGLAERYAKAIQDLGVPLSPTKSICSSLVGEFAGFVGFRTNRSSCVFRPYKFGHEKYHNPMNLLYSLGKSVGRRSEKWKCRLVTFNRTRRWRNPDLSPLLPDSGLEGVIPPNLDTTRLELLCTNFENSYSIPKRLKIGKRKFSEKSSESSKKLTWKPVRTEEFVRILLDKQESVFDAPTARNWDELLAPAADEPREQARTPIDKVLTTDPLYQEVQETGSIALEKPIQGAPPCAALRELAPDMEPLLFCALVPPATCWQCQRGNCLYSEFGFDPPKPPSE